MSQHIVPVENEYLKMIVHKIKSIDFATIEVPVKNGVYAFIGNNGIGKSTIIYCLAQLINRASLEPVFNKLKRLSIYPIYKV